MNYTGKLKTLDEYEFDIYYVENIMACSVKMHFLFLKLVKFRPACLRANISNKPSLMASDKLMRKIRRLSI